MDMNRRTMIGAGVIGGAALTLAGSAQAAGGEPQTIELWPGSPPGGGASKRPETLGTEGAGKGALTGISVARMRVYRPARPNGVAVLVMAGGGYFRIQQQNESAPAARWLASIGITAFELLYRLPGDGWPREAPFADAQRAMRLIRANAARFGIDPKKVGVLGFSAGGHLAAMTAAAPDAPRYAAIDATDTQPVRPDFAGLMFPVITLRPPFDTTRTKKWLVGDTPTDADRIAWSCESHVTPQTPPVFLGQCADDPIAAIDNSLIFFDACRKAKVPCEMHIFEKGGHGFGVEGSPDSTNHTWPALFESWLKMHRLA